MALAPHGVHPPVPCVNSGEAGAGQSGNFLVIRISGVSLPLGLPRESESMRSVVIVTGMTMKNGETSFPEGGKNRQDKDPCSTLMRCRGWALLRWVEVDRIGQTRRDGCPDRQGNPRGGLKNGGSSSIGLGGKLGGEVDPKAVGYRGG